MFSHIIVLQYIRAMHNHFIIIIIITVIADDVSHLRLFLFNKKY